MNCPIDNTTLAISERQGIEIDYCPKCRGVWLDRGELDKLIDAGAAHQPSRDRDEHRPSYSDDRHLKKDDQYYKKKKKESFLGELFDF